MFDGVDAEPVGMQWASEGAGFFQNRDVALAPAFQADNRARPLARRALITARPPRVFMRARNPWLRLRFKVLG